VAPSAVLILDDDLGFCMWLGKILNQAGIRALPACRSEEALEIGNQAEYRIGLVIVNPDVDGCGAVLAQNSGARVMTIGEAGKLAVSGTLQRPPGNSLPPPERYVRAVREVLNQTSAC
jgi:hypothetical protein